ncbi:MAG: ferrous iron transport protein A [Phycisphaerae bacterium]|nr:ferrous iron transport protein A [Gemmatimonadaceae bacterium]
MPLPTIQPTPAVSTSRVCALSACQSGSRATVVDIGCSPDEACRLRALGVCEGASISVIDSRHCMVLDVRGTRLALGNALTSGITVQTDSARR